MGGRIYTRGASRTLGTRGATRSSIPVRARIVGGPGVLLRASGGAPRSGRRAIVAMVLRSRRRRIRGGGTGGTDAEVGRGTRIELYIRVLRRWLRRLHLRTPERDRRPVARLLALLLEGLRWAPLVPRGSQALRAPARVRRRGLPILPLLEVPEGLVDGLRGAFRGASMSVLPSMFCTPLYADLYFTGFLTPLCSFGGPSR